MPATRKLETIAVGELLSGKAPYLFFGYFVAPSKPGDGGETVKCCVREDERPCCLGAGLSADESRDNLSLIVGPGSGTETPASSPWGGPGDAAGHRERCGRLVLVSQPTHVDTEYGVNWEEASPCSILIGLLSVANAKK